MYPILADTDPAQDTIRAMVSAERERCAKIAERTTGDECWPKGETIGQFIARKIRDHHH
jgi:hypothetical protein